MLILGIVLIIVAALVPKLAFLLVVGVILAVVGAVLLALSLLGREVGGRRFY